LRALVEERTILGCKNALPGDTSSLNESGQGPLQLVTLSNGHHVVRKVRAVSQRMAELQACLSVCSALHAR
jgi:hypothetical protein